MSKYIKYDDILKLDLPKKTMSKIETLPTLNIMTAEKTPDMKQAILDGFKYNVTKHTTKPLTEYMDKYIFSNRGNWNDLELAFMQNEIKYEQAVQSLLSTHTKNHLLSFDMCLDKVICALAREAETASSGGLSKLIEIMSCTLKLRRALLDFQPYSENHSGFPNVQYLEPIRKELESIAKMRKLTSKENKGSTDE